MRMTVTNMKMRKRLVWMVLISALAFSLAQSSCIAQNKILDIGKEHVALNLGLIGSITVPASWKITEPDKPDSHEFRKLRRHLWDCMISMQVDSPVKISSKLLSDLKSLMNHPKLTDQQIDSLKELPYISDTTNDRGDQIKVTTVSINGKRLLIVEHSGKTTGPCQPMAGGGTRRPLLSYVRGAAYVIVDAETVQTIHFDADVMNDIKPCSVGIRTALRSIEWI